MSSPIRNFTISGGGALIFFTAVGALWVGGCGESHGREDGAVDADPVTWELFHRLETVDAVNLEISRPPRAFQWSIFGCDVSGGGNGRVEVDGVDLLLRPSAGDDDFAWPGGRTDLVRLSPGPEPGQLTDGGEPEIIWEPGGICAMCGGSLGPTGLEPCEDPFFLEP
jgi:hypothetical protein